MIACCIAHHIVYLLCVFVGLLRRCVVNLIDWNDLTMRHTICWWEHHVLPPHTLSISILNLVYTQSHRLTFISFNFCEARKSMHLTSLHRNYMLYCCTDLDIYYIQIHSYILRIITGWSNLMWLQLKCHQRNWFEENESTRYAQGMNEWVNVDRIW